MAALFEGNVLGKVVNPEFGGDKNGKPKVKWEMQVTEGEHKDKRASYSGKLDEENIKFTKRDMMLIGWKGKDVRTFVDDVKAANLTIPFQAEIATNTYQDTGKTSQWTSARFSGGAPLKALDKDKLDQANKWFSDAGAVTQEEKIPF